MKARRHKNKGSSRNAQAVVRQRYEARTTTCEAKGTAGQHRPRKEQTRTKERQTGKGTSEKFEHGFARTQGQEGYNSLSGTPLPSLIPLFKLEVVVKLLARVREGPLISRSDVTDKCLNTALESASLEAESPSACLMYS